MGYMNITTNFVTLSPGPTTLFTAKGTSLVIHANPDDEMTNSSGNSGERIICGFLEEKQIFLLSLQKSKLGQMQGKDNAQNNELNVVYLHEPAWILTK